MFSAGLRREYWPAHYVSPGDDTLHLHGLDLGTDILADEAMQISAATSLQTATEPSRLFVPIENPDFNIFVFHPAKTRALGKTDYLVAALSPVELLRESLTTVDHDQIQIPVHFRPLGKRAPRLVASWPDLPEYHNLRPATSCLPPNSTPPTSRRSLCLAGVMPSSVPPAKASSQPMPHRRLSW